MQIRYSKTENWNCETAGTKKSKVKIHAQWKTQTLAAFKQNSLTDMNFYGNPWLLPNSLTSRESGNPRISFARLAFPKWCRGLLGIPAYRNSRLVNAGKHSPYCQYSFWNRYLKICSEVHSLQFDFKIKRFKRLTFGMSQQIYSQTKKRSH